MKTAFLMTTHDHATGWSVVELVDHATGKTLIKRRFKHGDLKTGNRLDVGRAYWSARRGITRYCIKNGVMVTNPPHKKTLVRKLIDEINPITINQFAAIGDIVATACEPKRGGQ